MAILDLKEEKAPVFQRTLPRELWEEILKRVQINPLDLVGFRSICNSWRSILPTPLSTSIFPLRIPPLPTVSESMRICRFFVSETNGYLYRPPAWSGKNPAIVVFESNLPRGSFYPCLLYPMYGKRDRINDFPKVLDLRQCWIRSLFTAYYVRVAWPAKSGNNEDNVLEEEWIKGANLSLIDNVVLISYDIVTNKSTICNPVYARITPSVDLGVVVLTGHDDLYFLSTRSMNWESITCKNVADSKFDDIINYGGMLWTIDKSGRAYVLDDVKSRMLTRVVDVKIPFDHLETNRRRLVEASGELYMLAQSLCMEMRIEVYKMQGKEWVKVKGVGEHIFYLMRGVCFSGVAGRELCLSNNDSSIKKGNIMFVDDQSFGVTVNPLTPQELRSLSGVALERALRGFSVYDFGKGKRVRSSDELPEMFCFDIGKGKWVRSSDELPEMLCSNIGKGKRVQSSDELPEMLCSNIRKACSWFTLLITLCGKEST